jgi:hypothetical protein
MAKFHGLVIGFGIMAFIALLPLTVIAAPPPAPFAPDAHWISAPAAAQPDPSVQAAPAADPPPLPIFRRAFALHPRTPGAKLAAATLSISGLGQFEAQINGRNVTAAVLTPSWSDYRKRVYFDTFAVTRFLRPGPNVIAVQLGNGMYNVEPTPDRYEKFHASFGPPKLIAQLTLRFADGSRQTIVSDAAWKTAPGPITFTSIYGGEDYDARLEPVAWDTPIYDDIAWSPATPVDGPGGALEPETIAPVVPNDTYTPIRITHPKPDTAVYDLGQNFAGWPEIAVTGPRGASFRLIPGELLDANGLVTQRSAGASPRNPVFFTYTLRGGGTASSPERWHPLFSYYGFRYVQVEYVHVETTTPAPSILSLDARFLHDAVAVDGHFTSSDDLLNRIHTLINRAMLANMVSILTDCPTREKLGWLEETHLAAASLMYNYSLGALYAKQAADMRDAQLPNGLVPSIAPEFPVFSGGFRDSPEWGAAVILSPWAAYQFYGSLALLRDQYPAMQRYAAYLNSKAQDHILVYGLGDWYDIGPRAPGVSQLTSPGVTATAIYYQSLTSLARIATLLNHPGEAAAYTQEAAEVRTAFNARFYHSDTHQYDTGSQTANAMPLVLGLVPEPDRAAVLANLVADIHAHSDHVTAGDIGFHYVVRALTDGNESDVLYAMLSRTDPPSYGAQLAHGATTLTEAWDANPNSSQDHFMLGHAEEWFYRGLAGIDIDLSRPPGSQIEIRPAVPGDLRSVSATFHSALGPIASAWTRTGDTLRMDITLPTRARITVPANFTHSISVDGAPAPSTITLTPGRHHILSHR